MSNALQPIFDLFWDAGKIFFTWVFDGWIEPKKSLDDFFKAANIKNSLGEYPEVVIDNKTVFVVFVPAGLSVDDFLKHKDALELYLNNEVKMEASSGWVRIEVLKELPEIIEYEIPSKTKELCIPFAKSIDGIEYIDFIKEPHILLTGSTGSGKSITLRNIITSLVYLYPNQIELVLIDFKIVELSIFKSLKQVRQYATDIEQAKEVISGELEEAKNRYKLFEKYGVTNIYDYNKKVSNDKKLKYRFIVIEEFVMLIEDKKKIAMKMLKQLSVISRASGQFIIITGQRFDNTVIDLVIRAQFGNRLCHKMQDEANSKLILDDVGAEKIKTQGRMIFKRNSEKIECQSYFISDYQVKNIIKPYLKLKKEVKKDMLPSNTNKGTLEKNYITNDKLQGKENKTTPVVNKKVNFEYDLSFLDKL
jgi:S-DNA-T family DNA segregation ATPase FtsK/SpoIIIE|nr:MAG TPA: DNA TRANSLOCASE FTSK [Caudoviricetes sp.]